MLHQIMNMYDHEYMCLYIDIGAINAINIFSVVYVQSSELCNELSFNLGGTAVGNSIGSRSWSIKVTKYIIFKR